MKKVYELIESIKETFKDAFYYLFSEYDDMGID